MSIVDQIEDYMFTTKNLIRYTKHIISFDTTTNKNNNNNIKPKINNANTNTHKMNTNKAKQTNKQNNIYKPRQQDSLFWCFYIIKHGFINYEMEIGGKHFFVEKNEKINYVEKLRKNKELLKLHKIKPFTEVEDDLTNQTTISIKTFFALCALENINVILVNKHKYYELICSDDGPINIVHKNMTEHWIELQNDNNDDNDNNNVKKYRDTYLKLETFDSSLKSISAYKVEELNEICSKLGLDAELKKLNKNKLTKKAIYEFLVQNY